MIGSRIGDYVVEEELMATAVQVAYAAAHVLLPRRARVTVAAAGREAALPLMRAACVLEALRHPGVPRVYECGSLGGRPWIATELVEGWTIGDTLARSVMTAEAVAILVRDASEILAHAHRRGVIHGNLTASVLVRGATRPDASLCITGWDSARCGEAVSGEGDIHALGAIAYRALSAEDPTASAVQQCPGVPLALTRLIDRMLAADPSQRPTAEQLRTEATQVLELIELPLADELDVAIDVVEVELVDISRRPPPPPPPSRVRWTPPGAYEPPPHGVMIGVLKPRGKITQG